MNNGSKRHEEKFSAFTEINFCHSVYCLNLETGSQLKYKLLEDCISLFLVKKTLIIQNSE